MAASTRVRRGRLPRRGRARLVRAPGKGREAPAAAIREAVEALSRHPLIGRPRDEGLRELVISFGRTGYVALYRFRPERDEVRVLALRHQRELDYP